MKVLLVRLGALGDIVHAVPVAAALRRAVTGVRIDWAVDRRHAELLALFPVADRIVELDFGSWRHVIGTSRRLRAEAYDVALDVQGLMKSALVARLSGARRVVGFARAALREPMARALYTETIEPDDHGHVIRKNLSLLRALDVPFPQVEFPVALPASAVADEIAREYPAGYGLINPGAGWPNKQWPAKRFGALAAAIRRSEGLPSVVVWGPGEDRLARAVAANSDGAAEPVPPTGLRDLFAVIRGAAFLVSGDTAPIHLAAAVGTPVVGLYGPTSPERNGPWSADDVSVSRYGSCRCHHKRRCTEWTRCLDTIEAGEVAAAVHDRLKRARNGRTF